MKKLLMIGLVLLVAAAFTMPAVSAVKPGTDFNGPHFTLNLIGKKESWGGYDNEFDNPERHTIFVPMYTEGHKFNLKTPNIIFENGVPTLEDEVELPGVKILITQPYGAEDFAVTDGNACNDNLSAFSLPAGKTYDVYIAVKAKDPKAPTEPQTDITGWVQAQNESDGGTYYYLNIGSVSVKKNDDWKDITDIFFVSEREDALDFFDVGDGLGMWVFEYLQELDDLPYPEFDELEYFWQFQNTGNKLIQIRFYESGTWEQDE